MEETIRKIAIMQPYIFPYIGYFQLINAVDKFVIYDDVDFIIRGYINRNNILINGKRNLFTLPVKDKSQNRSIRKHLYGFDKKWKRKFFKKLEVAYSKAPYFDAVYKLIKNVFEYKNRNVSVFNTSSLKLVCRYLNIKTEIVDSSSLYDNNDLNGQFRILDISKKENTDMYINPIGGKKLYNSNYFEANDITLRFIKPQEIHYNQFSNSNFVPNLSIIDVLMFNNKQEVLNLLNRYKLVK